MSFNLLRVFKYCTEHFQRILLLLVLIFSVMQYELLLVDYSSYLSIPLRTTWLRESFPFAEFFLILFLLFECIRYLRSTPPVLLEFEKKYFLLFIVAFSGILSAYCFTPLPLLHMSKSRLFIELFLFCFFVLQNRSYRQILIQSIIALGVLQGMIGILQVVLGHSLGLSLMKEPILSNSMLGVAKIEFFGTKLLRAYGTFLHPNILAAWLLISLGLTSSLKYTEKTTILFHRSLPLLWVQVFLCVALFFTFSKTALLILFVPLLFLLFTKYSSYLKKSAVGVLIIIVLSVSIPLLFFLLTLEFYNISTLTERVLYFLSSIQGLLHYPLGIGLGSNTLLLGKSPLLISPWEYQPVHNVFLLLTSELGIISGFAFLMLTISFIGHLKKNIPTYTSHPMILILPATLLLFACTDHLWLTSFPAMILAGSSISLLLSE